MSTVYVRWYGNVVQGELLDGETMGMKHVRIPLDGHHPVALFTPQHIYDSPEQVTEKSSINVAKSVEISQNPPKIATEQPKISKNENKGPFSEPIDLNNEALMGWIRFKCENWDNERNHLRTDKLDEFYQLWREQHSATSIPIDSPNNPYYKPPTRIVSDAKMEKIKQELKKPLKPKKTVKVVQLSLFD